MSILYQESLDFQFISYLFLTVVVPVFTDLKHTQKI